MRLGGGHGVVAVPGGKEQGRAARRAAGGCLRIGVQPAEKRLGLCAGRGKAAGDVPAALHQLKIIERRQVFARCKQRLKQGVRGVVRKQHDVRQLKRRRGADGQPRGHALGHGRLGRADGRGAAGRFVVGLEVEREQHAAPRRCRGRCRARSA